MQRQRRKEPLRAAERERGPQFKTPEQPSPLDLFVSYARTFIEGGRALKRYVPPIYTQPEAQTPEAQARRDMIMDRLGEIFDFNAKEQMAFAEDIWRSKSPDGGVMIEPWMKKELNMDDPDQAVVVVGVQRDVSLAIADGMQYWLRELEFPNQVLEADGTTRSRINRIIYYEAWPIDLPTSPQIQAQTSSNA